VVEAVRLTFRRVLLLVLPLLGAPSTVFAHRLDEYLQATIVVIEPGTIRLRINLTPGVSVAEQVLAKIDRDRDGVISAKESAAYGELLKRDLVVGLDGGKVELQLMEMFWGDYFGSWVDKFGVQWMINCTSKT